jgi:ribosomal protein S1
VEGDKGSSPPAADGQRKGPDGQEKAAKAAGAEGKARRRKRPEKAAGKREPRERPAFGVGDVVFGKIIEITDDAIVVDLSGKAKGIFDRAEMLLPDEPPEPAPPPPREASEQAKGAHPPHSPSQEGAPHEAETPNGLRADEGGAAAVAVDAASAASSAEHASAEVEVGVAPMTQGTPTASQAPSASSPSDLDVPPTVTSGGVERKHAGRRIIVAAAAREISAPPVPAPTASEISGTRDTSSPSTESAEEKEAAEDNGVGGALAADEVAKSEDAATHESAAPAPPKPAPYAPPIVLELGAHFVGLVHTDGSRGGLVVLTRHPHRASRAKSMVASALRENKNVKGLVTGVVKGGAEVDVDGLRAFVPGSHMDRRPGADLHGYIGQRLEFAVTQYGKRGRDVVLSRKAQLDAEAKACREAALAELSVGSVVDGVVKSVVSFGAFLDVGGVEGLVSLPEMSHNRSDSPSDVFKVGETTKVKILRIDEKGKVWLSRKAAYPDPRIEALKKYAVGTRHSGKVVRLQPFGAFVELEPGLDGLIHTLDLSLKRIEHPSDVVKVGDSIDVVVSQLDTAHGKVALHPVPAGAAAEEPHQKVVLHKPLKVVVVAIEPGGLLVRVLGATGRHSRGFITAAATGTPRGTELRKPFPVGTQLEAKVVELDPKRGDLKLSIKALREDTERSAYQQYRQQVNREAKFGTFGDLLAKKGLTTK